MRLHSTRLAFTLGAVVTAMGSTVALSETLTVALANNLNTLDPHMTASVGTDLSLLSHLYPPLVMRGPDLKLRPHVATSWERIDDLTWRFRLRDDARFSDGTPIDAAAVKWNIDRVKNPDTRARVGIWFALVSEVRVISPTELEIRTSAPFPALDAQLSMFLLLPPAWAAAHNPAAETSSGGAYAVREMVPGDHITLAANPGYWGQRPQFDEVVFRVIPDAASRIAALLAGEVDLVTNIPTGEIARIGETGRARAGSVPSTRTAFIKINTEKPPMDDKTVRQALNHAVDKAAIAEALFDGRARVSDCQILTPDYVGYNPDLSPYSYDPDLAVQMLKESGADLSEPIELEVATNTYLNGEEVTQAVAEMLGAVGVQTRITEMQYGTWMDRYLKSRELGRMGLASFAWPTLDADGILNLFTTGNPYAYWSNPDFDAAVKAARAPTDPAARAAEYRKATAIMCDEAPAIFLYTQPTTYGTSNRVTWAARGDDWIRAWDVSLAQ